jgi:FkbM family methyltransferase
LTVDDLATVRIADMSIEMLRSDFQFEKFASGNVSPPSLWPIDLILAHHWRHGLNPPVLDVGAKYGVAAMLLAKFMAANGRGGPIFCFEPGASWNALVNNLKRNGFEHAVRPIRFAVSDSVGVATIYSDPAHPEDNHIIRRHVPQEIVARPCETVSLDAFAASHSLEPPLVAKVDTQGAEWEVIRGMRDLIATGPVTLLSEFTPWTFEGRAAPEDFLALLAQTHIVIGLTPLNLSGSFAPENKGQRVDDHVAFTDAVRSSKAGWTDILCLPLQLPNVDRLAQSIA